MNYQHYLYSRKSHAIQVAVAVNIYTVMKISKRNKLYIINIIAETSGSAIYSILYFILISRFLSPEFNIDLITTGLAVGLSYFVAVYIPFHTYRIHIVPFISIIRAIQKRSWKILLHKLPAQFTGALIGVALFYVFMRLTEDYTRVLDIWNYKLEPGLNLFINSVTVYVLCYFFCIIRLLFKSGRSTGTFFFSIIIAILFLFSGQIYGVSALNPFGYLALFLIDNSYSPSFDWYWSVFTHVIVPTITSILTYYIITDMYKEKEVKPTQPYDIQKLYKMKGKKSANE